jgi:hypothetical protein
MKADIAAYAGRLIVFSDGRIASDSPGTLRGGRHDLLKPSAWRCGRSCATSCGRS